MKPLIEDARPPDYFSQKVIHTLHNLMANSVCILIKVMAGTTGSTTADDATEDPLQSVRSSL